MGSPFVHQSHSMDIHTVKHSQIHKQDLLVRPHLLVVAVLQSRTGRNQVNHPSLDHLHQEYHHCLHLGPTNQASHQHLDLYQVRFVTYPHHRRYPICYHHSNLTNVKDKSTKTQELLQMLVG